MKYYVKDHFNILYEDNHLLVVEKPANILTQPDPLNKKPSLEKMAKDFLSKREGKESVFLHVIHRLDKEVSGIVLFAKSSKALSRLNEQMREQKIIRHYLAFIEGSLEQSKGFLEHYLSHGSKRAIITNESDNRKKKAQLKYWVIGSDKNSSCIVIELITGRYHQIRAQFYAINHPICGDIKYGGHRKKNHRIMLHQYHLAWMHPVKKIPMSVFLVPQSWIV